jgi:hypothetical protein
MHGAWERSDTRTGARTRAVPHLHAVRLEPLLGEAAGPGGQGRQQGRPRLNHSNRLAGKCFNKLAGDLEA